MGSIVPALAKSARTGHPQFQKGNRAGHPPVTPDELNSIQEHNGQFAQSPGGAEFKYFYATEEQAIAFGNRMYGSGNYTVVSGQFPTSLLQGPVHVATEGDVFVVSIDDLPLGEAFLP